MEIRYINDQKTTKCIQKNGVTYLTFPGLSCYDDRIVHGFTTRLGGVSTGHLATMNTSFHRNDIEEHVRENHRRLAAAIGYDYRKLVFSDQVHETHIHICTDEDAGKGIMKESDIKNTDGLLTNVSGLPLMTFYADCVPLYFYDPVKKVVGLAHSGWRGTVAKIGTKMIAKMEAVYGSNPSDIITAIGPSICQSCYEVSRDVAEEFENAYPAEYHAEIMYAKNKEKYQLNLHRACELNFIFAGVKREHIFTTDICTCCNPDFLFSHRASKGMRGNLAAVIMLKEDKHVSMDV